MLTKTIPAYLYVQYADDSDLQAFVASYNSMSQEYVDWFNQVYLPDYIGNNEISGQLLDWVGEGLYGITRPVLAAPHTNVNAIAIAGVFNSFTSNTLPFNKYSSKTTSPIVYYTVDDDVYKRVLTWHFYKGDGKTFNVRWLKRRIQRFIAGAYGADINGSYMVTADQQQFGTGDGLSTNFQITYNFGYGPVAILGGMTSTPIIYVNGSVVTNYTMSSTFLVTFNTAPASGDVISWSGSFTDSVANTADIGVSFPSEGTAAIRFAGRSVTVKSGTFNTTAFNTTQLNAINFTTTSSASNPMAQVFKAAVQAGVIELPFQYTFIVYA